MASDCVAGILLAAGYGRRFGGDKLLATLANGTQMAVASARSLHAACNHCITVLRPGQQLLGNLLAAEGYRVVYSHEAELGMGHSLAAAVRSAPAARGWLVALADMPTIAAESCSLVAAAIQGGASLAAPLYRGRRGHPVGFAGTWFEQLSRLEGDAGAREILAEHSSSLVLLPCDDPGVLIDIDTPAELAGLACETARVEPEPGNS